MTKITGGNLTRYDVDDNQPYTLNTSNYIDIGSAKTGGEIREVFIVSNDTPHDIYVKGNAFDDPDSTTKLGRWVPARSQYEFPKPIPQGAISARAVTGTPTIFVTEDTNL